MAAYLWALIHFMRAYGAPTDVINQTVGDLRRLLLVQRLLQAEAHQSGLR